MKILFTSYSQRRINRLSPVLSIGMYMFVSSVIVNVKFLPSLDFVDLLILAVDTNAMNVYQ